MNHPYIENSNIVDYYLLGKLPPDQQARFEEHFIDCPECLDRLEATREFVRAFRGAAAEDAARWTGNLRVGVIAWFVRPSRGQQAALLAMILIVVAVPVALVAKKIRRIQWELNQAQQTSAEWQRRYEEQQHAKSVLENELQQAQANLAAQKRQQEIPREDQDQQANQTTQTQSRVHVFALNIVRGSGSEPANTISIPPTARSIVLSLELENNAEIQSYRATISTADQRIIWKASNLKPRNKDELRIKLDSKVVKPGKYWLALEGLGLDGHFVPEHKYLFRVSGAKGGK